MANAITITINDLTANSSVAAATAQVLDTGTAAVTLETADLAGTMGDIFIDVQNTAAANLTATVVGAAAGDNPPSFRRTGGDYTTPNIAQNAHRLLGPFESARFAEGGGKLKVTFTPASGTITANFTAYRLPKNA